MTRTVYQIRDMLGETIAEHVKVMQPGGGKSMFWRVPGMPCNGLMGMSTPDLPLYGSERIPEFQVGQTVLLCEGEGATEACWALGFDALGTVTGAGATPGEDALSVLLAFDIVTWEDYDDAGNAHMHRSAGGLIRLGGGARRLIWAGAIEKGDDAADFLARGGQAVAVELMIRAALPWAVETVPDRAPLRPVYRESDDRVETARAHLLRVVEERLGPPKTVRQGTPWWCCPFHGDRSPSFKVDTREPFYRCFGCDAKGDVFTFLRELDGVGFKDALSELAPAVGLGGIPRLWG